MLKANATHTELPNTHTVFETTQSVTHSLPSECLTAHYRGKERMKMSNWIKHRIRLWSTHMYFGKNNAQPFILLFSKDALKVTLNTFTMLQKIYI